MAVRAKFRVVETKVGLGYRTDPETKEHITWHMPTVVLTPVYAGQNASEEDRAFWDATPNGRLEMCITNHSAAEFFELGETYHLTFEKADAA